MACTRLEKKLGGKPLMELPALIGARMWEGSLGHPNECSFRCAGQGNPREVDISGVQILMVWLT